MKLFLRYNRIYFLITILFGECFAPCPFEMYCYQDQMFLGACESGDIETACGIFETHPLSAELRLEALRLAINGKQERIVGWLMSIVSSEQRLEAYHYVLANENINMLDIVWPLMGCLQVMETPIQTHTTIPIPIPTSISMDAGLVQIQPVADARDGLIAFLLESSAVSILAGLKGLKDK